MKRTTKNFLEGESPALNTFRNFIDHSFEERRKILKGKQRKGSIINIKLILDFFANENFSRAGFSNQHMDSVIAPVLQVKFRFMGCLVKANALVSGNSGSLI